VGIVLLCILGVFLAACGPTSAAASGSSQPCTPTTPGANVYRGEILTQVRELSLINSADPISARNEALRLLVDRVKRWSASVDIPVDNGNIIRITLTYLSPELMQIIILNHRLYRNTTPGIDIEQTIRTKMNEVANREEHIFLMTVTYSAYDPPSTPEINRVTLNIPIEELTLVNSRNAHIHALDVDPPLRQDIIASREPLSGYIAFPIGVGSTENCMQVLEYLRNTIINVSVGRVIINGTDYAHQLAWSVKYHPLVDMDNGLITPRVPNPPFQSDVPINHPPPNPVTGNLSEQVEAVYWQEMTLHVWGYVTDP
jgi:hypothetical protein